MVVKLNMPVVQLLIIALLVIVTFQPRIPVMVDAASVSCLGLDYNPVKWWVVLTDARTSSEPAGNTYKTGVYFDSKGVKKQFVDHEFSKLLSKQVETAYAANTDFLNYINGGTFDFTKVSDNGYMCNLLKEKKGVNLNWFHETATEMVENRFQFKSGFKEAHQKLLLALNDEEKEGYVMSHSMRLPKNPTSWTKLFSANPSDDGWIMNGNNDFSQHAICSTFEGETQIKDYKDMIQATKPALVLTNSGCNMITISPTLSSCDDEWEEYVENFIEGDKKTDIVKRMLRDEKAYEITKEHCVFKKGPIKVGDFEVFGFNNRKLNECNSGKKVKYNSDFVDEYADLMKEYYDSFHNKDNHLASNNKYNILLNEAQRTEMKTNALCESDKKVCSFPDIGLDVYLYISHHYKLPMYVITDQVKFPSIIKSNYGVYRSGVWKNQWSKDEPVKSESHHEKIAFSLTGSKVCFGDSNRGFKQTNHAGSVFCFDNAAIHTVINSNKGPVNVYNLLDLNDPPTGVDSSITTEDSDNRDSTLYFASFKFTGNDDDDDGDSTSTSPPRQTASQIQVEMAMRAAAAAREALREREFEENKNRVTNCKRWSGVVMPTKSKRESKPYSRPVNK